METRDKKFRWLKAVFTVVIGLFVAYVLIFIGIKAQLTDTGLSLSDGLFARETISYSEMEAVEWRDSLEKGGRTFGVGGFRTSSGTFANTEFGAYQLYAYNGVSCAVVVRHGGKVSVFNADTEEKTKALYDALSQKLQ